MVWSLFVGNCDSEKNEIHATDEDSHFFLNDFFEKVEISPDGSIFLFELRA